MRTRGSPAGSWTRHRRLSAVSTTPEIADGRRLMADGSVPASLGFRMPAEWEPHHATWIGWPHNASDWPGKFAAIPWVYGEIARKLVPGEIVRILVNSAAHERGSRRVLERVGVDAARVEFFRVPTNRGWTRDFGPLFVRRERPRPEVAIARFRFNAWAKYRDWKRDDQVPELVAKRLGLRLLRARDRKSTRLNSSHRCISYAVFCLKKKSMKNEVF